jgi:alpha-glucosidase
MRETIRLRYALLPYTYSEFLGSVTSHTPFISHLSLHFDSARVRQIDDQFLYGGSIMVAPVYEPNARGRFVHLPSCRWLHWNAARWDERRMAVYEPGDHFIAAPLEAIPLFLRENTLVPIAVPSASRTEHEKLDLLGFVTDRATYLYRFDDGYSYGFQRGIVSEIEIIVERRGGDYQISCAYLSRSAGDSVRELRCMLYDERGMVEQTVRIR